MTIEEARKRKEQLGRELTRLVCKFQEETGIGIKGFEQINVRQLRDSSSRLVNISVITESI